MAARSMRYGWAAAGVGTALVAALFSRRRAGRRSPALDARETAQGGAEPRQMGKNEQDQRRAGTSDDILGISHAGGRDQYGGSFGGGQSGGGSYANPHTGTAPGQGGNRYGSERGSGNTTGGQSAQGYYGGGQLGDRNYADHSHSAGSTIGGPEHGDKTYQAHASQRGENVDDALASSLHGTGFNEHQGFGAEHQGQSAQGREHGGPHIEPDPEPGRAKS